MARNPRNPVGDELTEESGVASETPPSPPEAPSEEAPAVSAPVDAGPALDEPKNWAKKLGKVGKDPKVSINKKPRPAAFSWDHAAADQIHGWSLHDQHSATPLTITRAAYEAALVKAGNPDERGNYAPHPEALSPFKRVS